MQKHSKKTGLSFGTTSKSLVLAFAFFLAIQSMSVAADKPAADKPNVVFILIDDLGWADLSCYGNKFHESPNIDRLASQGMRFTDAYAASPVCSSTRCSLMTGNYPATVGITDFIPGHWRPWEELVVPPIKNQLPLADVTLAEPLKAAGYATCYLGKWHLGGTTHYPHKQGFDVALVQRGAHFGTTLTGTRTIKLNKDEYLSDRLTDEAIRFIKKNKDRPFFVYLSHYAVHIPLQAKPDKISKYEKKAAKLKPKSHPTYGAMIEHVDESVGRVMETLDQLKLSENTIVVFFSDNGGLISRFDKKGPIVSPQTPLRAEKGTVYEGGIRVPMIVRHPGMIEPNTVCHEPVSSVDFFPTIMQWTACKTPDNHRVDGLSLLPLLKQTGKFRRDAIYFHYPHYHHMDPSGAIRAGDYKLIEHFDDGQLELYNLQEDISEKHNLATKMPGKAKSLQTKLAAWRKSVGALMPAPNPNHDAAKAHLWQRRSRPVQPKPKKK